MVHCLSLNLDCFLMFLIFLMLSSWYFLLSFRSNFTYFQNVLFKVFKEIFMKNLMNLYMFQ